MKLTSAGKISLTSSLGNQEKWRTEDGYWIKIDQFGYESLAEHIASRIIKKIVPNDIKGLTVVSYDLSTCEYHGNNVTCSVSRDFKKDGESIVTISKLLRKTAGDDLGRIFAGMKNDKERISFIVENISSVVGLKDFPRYLTLLFEIDGLILNDDRHLNNIAVIEKRGRFKLCPIFDNGAAFLSNQMYKRMDIDPKYLAGKCSARPLNTSFKRQVKIVRELYGTQIGDVSVDEEYVRSIVLPTLEYYPQRDRDIILSRVLASLRQGKKNLVV